MTFKQILLCVAGLLIVFIPSACIDLKQPGLDMQYYTLEYDAPSITGYEPLPFIVRIEKFDAAPLYNSRDIIYKDREYKRGSYPYHRWMTRPADIATYMIGRDLKKSGMFKGVIMPGERNREVSFRVSGMIEGFHELNTGREQHGVLTVSITLAPEAGPAKTKGMDILQKTYNAIEKMEKKSPVSLAEALSRAMQKVSHEICIDMYGYAGRND
ncbi:MAG: hypothetical protein GX846_10165 [Deltaproteobacteria bacterium]|nr:hypothetical protein [Deltaproteobacteria bacterium]